MKKKGITILPAGETSRSSLDTGMEALSWAVSSGSAEMVVETIRARRRTRHRRMVAATAAMALITLAFVWQAQPLSRRSSDVAPITARVAAPAKQVLSDGSVIELNKGAEIVVEFSQHVRRVVLRSGEAHFDVTKDAARPFVVAAGTIEVRAIGTAFAVQRNLSQVDVLVTEGSVAVDQITDSSGGPTPAAPGLTLAPQTIATLDAGNRVVVELAPRENTAPPAVLAVSATEQNDRLSWRVPRLEFSGTPLSDAITMFNQHGRVKLVLDPALGRLQMSGLLRADDIDSLLLLLKNEFGIEAQPRGEREIVLRRP